MAEDNKKQDKYIEFAIDYFLNIPPGQVVPHVHLRKMANMTIPAYKDAEDEEEYREMVSASQMYYMNFIQRVREKLLREYKVCLKNEWGVGYYTLESREQIKYGVERTRRGIKKKIRQGKNIILYVNFNNVSINDKKIAHDNIAALSMARQMINQSIRDIED